MGRFRNLSQSLRAAAFNNHNGHASPSTVTDRREQSPDDYVTSKEIPAIARESSSTSVLDSLPATRPSQPMSRPVSQVYTSPTTGYSREDQIEELKPVFRFVDPEVIDGIANLTYGYFLKLNDLDINGKPNTDRNWTECFAQLVGTILSLWDAAALDAAGQDGEVAPTFINLADASIKMIETLPTRNQNVQPLQNVLSVSTAGKNRYLFHFNSLHSLTQWTAGIRLAMFEHASLQELYTGSLIAGKGKTLNNIKAIMNKLRFVEEDWARVRFGAGTPWRRCWYVIEPPDEKEWQKASKTMKKRGVYERPEYPRGDIKFYDTQKTKRATPIATISNVYSAYAVYPQSKTLMNQSTLVKLEGTITIHSQPESQTEGFVFVMPEVHPAVSGFEMLLRFLFPIFDTFVLYGRPAKLIADTLDTRGLMFAMPKDRRYGYLDIIDVAGLIHTEDSDKWTEREWRKKMKELVSRRMTMATQGRTSNIENDGRRSLGIRPGLRYGDETSIHSNGMSANQSTDMVFDVPKKPYTASPASSVPAHINHTRSVSESVTAMTPLQQRRQMPSQLSIDKQARYSVESPEVSPVPATSGYNAPYKHGARTTHELVTSSNSSVSEVERVDPEQVTHDLLPEPTPPAPVNQPFFQHQPSDRPQRRPMDRPDIRRERSRMSNATLDQLVDASRKGVNAGAAAHAAWRGNGRSDGQERGVTSQHPNMAESDANPFSEAIITDFPSNVPTQRDQTINERPPISRTSTEHSIKRKPLPLHTQATTPTEIFLGPPMFNREPTPDYASSAHSEEPPLVVKKSGGVRKIVGNPNYVVEKRSGDIPDFDFGITQSLTPGPSRPGTAAGRKSPLDGHSPPAPQTPNENRRLHTDVAGGGGGGGGGRSSPLPSPHSRPSSRQMWQPHLATGRQSPGGLTAEEFVQQRASIARLPSGYVPRRTVSTNRVEEMKTPSPEQKQRNKLHKRNSSRNTSHGSLLDFSANLSAREQEHVARMTGSPLLNLPDRSRTPDPHVGLIGAISAREQDKRNMKEGISSHLAQAAIAHRQQQAQNAYMQQQVQAQYRPGPNAWGQQQLQQQTSWGLPGTYHPQQLQQHQAQPFYQPPQQNMYMQQNQYDQGRPVYHEYYAPQPGYRRQ